VRCRPGLLVSAALTVTIPGVLAVLAILGHEHAIAGTDAMAVTALSDDSTTVGPLPTAPTGTNAAVRDSVAQVQRTSGAPITVLSDVAASQQAFAMSLLGKAATAGQETSYQGVELASQSGMDGTVTMLSQVWHAGGGLTLIRTSSGPTSVVSYESGGQPSAGVFGVTKAMVALLGQHYVAVYRGTGAADGRVAAIIEVYRFDGTLAGRFWLDSRTMVPLRREVFDTSDKLVSDDAFVQVRIGALAGRPATAAVAAAPAPAWVTASSPGAMLASLAGQGWRLPAALSGGLPLYAASRSGTGTGQVTDLEYADGLNVISLFVQRGTLASSMPGWQPMSLDGRQVYVCGHSVTWAGHGLVYTMIADAPPATVTAAVAGLPDSDQPGLVGRLRHGLDRLAHLVDPFR
jgi:sigma-E factor negative regulatory protein RseB